MGIIAMIIWRSRRMFHVTKKSAFSAPGISCVAAWTSLGTCGVDPPAFTWSIISCMIGRGSGGDRVHQEIIDHGQPDVDPLAVHGGNHLALLGIRIGHGKAELDGIDGDVLVGLHLCAGARQSTFMPIAL